MRKKRLIATLAALGAGLGIAGYFTHNSRGPPETVPIEGSEIPGCQPLPANSLYQDRLAQEKEEEDRRFLEEFILGDNEDYLNESFQLTLERVIEHVGFTHYSSNVATLDEAELVLFGETHHLFGNELSSIFMHANIGENDKVLVESSSFFEDFSALKKQTDELDRKMERIAAPAERGTLDFYLSDFSDVQADLDLIFKNIDYLTRSDGEETSFYSSLVYHGKGTVVGVDAPIELKLQHLYSLIQPTFLQQAQVKMDNYQDLHPFEHWLLYQDLQVCQPEDPDQQERIQEYIGTIPSADEVSQDRDDAISDKTVDEVLSLQEGSKAYMIFGSSHISENRILSYLESAGVRYVAFVPQQDHVFGESREADEQHPLDYVEQAILPMYVMARVGAGSPNYTGPFEGAIKRP